jgi:hypothetical protein
MHITFVKKILVDGSACRKCHDVESRLLQAGYMARINEIIVADERDPGSHGLALAHEFNIKVAPFFIVRRDGDAKAYTIYLQFVREVLETSQ